MRKPLVALLMVVAIGLGIGLSALLDWEPGRAIGADFLRNAVQILKALPPVFILIGLFEVWVKREAVERHLGRGSGARGFLWAILLGGATIGPMVVALPVAASLQRKGARLAVVFTYVGAAAICRIPMTVFEATYLGLPFTVVRYVVSIPLVVASSILLGFVLERRGYRIHEET
jgi:uncharacterized membrane protein YraQ (UPF0718 family)